MNRKPIGAVSTIPTKFPLCPACCIWSLTLITSAGRKWWWTWTYKKSNLFSGQTKYMFLLPNWQQCNEQLVSTQVNLEYSMSSSLGTGAPVVKYLWKFIGWTGQILKTDSFRMDIIKISWATSLTLVKRTMFSLTMFSSICGCLCYWHDCYLLQSR